MADERRARAVAARDARDSRLERRLLVGRRAVLARRAVPPARGDERHARAAVARVASSARDIDRAVSRRPRSAASSRKPTSPIRRTTCARDTSRATAPFTIVAGDPLAGALRAARPARSGAADRRRPLRPDRLPQRAHLLRSRNAGTPVRRVPRALAPDGFLVLGKVETLLGASALDVCAGRRA